MTKPLRLTAIVAVLLVSGFTAEHLASQDRPDRPLPSLSEISRARLEEATGPTDALLTPEVDPAFEAPVTRRLPMGPVQGPVSSPFGPRVHPVSGLVRHHDGVDLAVPAGTAVWTVAPGTVRRVGRQRGYGLVVEIDHPGGVAPGGEPVRTRYAHLASVDASIQPGVRVARGVAFGASGGRPGRDGVSTGAHLHFEVRDTDGRPLDPARFVRLPEAVSTGPRWSGRAAPSPTPSLPTPAPPELTGAAPDTLDASGPEGGPPESGSPQVDSLGAGLPSLVLPDYPSLPSITGSPSPSPPPTP
ncbi:MAG: M23 family metallopeptidase [Bacteroidota bacterium]